MSTCFVSFVTGFLTDLGLSPATVSSIVAKLQVVAATFDANQPNETLTQIISDGFVCIRTPVEASLSSASTLSAAALIALAVLTFIVIIAIALAIAYRGPDLAFSVTLVAIILYVVGIIGIFLWFRSRSSQLETALEQRVTNCLQTVADRLEIFTSEERSALAQALCSYTV